MGNGGLSCRLNCLAGGYKILSTKKLELDIVLFQEPLMGVKGDGLSENIFDVIGFSSVQGISKMWQDVIQGCPQGSILGLLLWNVLFDSLLRIKLLSG